MKEILIKAETIKNKQNELMSLMAKEKCDDIHSVFRSKAFAESIIELEVELNLIRDIISKIS